MTTWLRGLLLFAIMTHAPLFAGCGDDGGSSGDDDDDLVDDAGAAGDDDDDDDDGDAGVPGETIACADDRCEVGGQACCSTPGAVTTFACIASDGACDGGRMACDGPEDCGDGEVCCIRFGGGALPGGLCEAEAACTGTGTALGCGGGVDDCNDGDVCCNDPTFGLSSDFCWPSACP